MDELRQMCGKARSAVPHSDCAQMTLWARTPLLQDTKLEAWNAVCQEKLTSKDPKFKIYLGANANGEKESPPPTLDIDFRPEVWHMQGDDANGYSLLAVEDGSGPWCGHAPPARHCPFASSSSVHAIRIPTFNRACALRRWAGFEGR
eukprot:4880222-Prymnesium_polylepis.1